jgi:hypothetical protein
LGSTCGALAVAAGEMILITVAMAQAADMSSVLLTVLSLAQ